jgi:ferrous iron transport protein B
MAKFGLQGKSFIPLLSAYACAVPAIMATRTIESKRDRLATILIAPLMTCSARLPVYTLIIAAFIHERPLIGPLLGTQAAAMLGLYVLGFLAAIVTARLLKSSILKSERTPFMLEMPPYRMPTLRSLGLRLLDRSKVFLRRAGTVILAVTLVLWVLLHLPLHDGKPPEIEHSFAGMIGQTVEPVIKPLGFDWKIGIGLISSLAAREVIVGTLGTIYSVEGADEHSVGLQQRLQSELTPGGAVALLIFFAFAMQCMSTIAVVRLEMARAPVRLHDVPRLLGGAYHQPGHPIGSHHLAWFRTSFSSIQHLSVSIGIPCEMLSLSAQAARETRRPSTQPGRI